MRSGWAGALWLAAAACAPRVDENALGLVKKYDAALIQAYRTGDARLVEGLAGDAEMMKLTGLIGVKLDAGINLDAELRELKPLGVTRTGDEIAVLTEERWHYADRRIGSGEQVGDASDDHYFMRYTLGLLKGRWVVTKVAFERPPQVGRKDAYVGQDFRAAHGVTTQAPDAQGGTR